MKKFIVLVLTVLSFTACAQQPTYPDAKLTPGVIDMKINQDNIKDTICKKGSTKDSRNVTRATKKKVFERYGLDYCHDSGKYEVDHFISLELGGDNDIDNLWPQRYAPAPGAREKDVVETHLKRSICGGVLTLSEGQKIIQQDWYACYTAIKAGKECSLKK